MISRLSEFGAGKLAKNLLLGLICGLFLFLCGGGSVFANTTTTTTTSPTKTLTATEKAAKQEEIRLKNLERMKEMADQSGSFEVDKYLQVGNEAKLEISADDDENNLIYRVINMMITVMGIVAILLYVIAGFFIITASDENQLQKGKTIIIYTSLGLVVAFASYLLVQVVLSAIFGVAEVS